MKGVEGLLSLPADLGVWLLLGYAFVVLAGARLLEGGPGPFRAGAAAGEGGFRYDADVDHYDCPQGERLTLHLVDPRAGGGLPGPGVGCAGCPLKAAARRMTRAGTSTAPWRPGRRRRSAGSTSGCRC